MLRNHDLRCPEPAQPDAVSSVGVVTSGGGFAAYESRIFCAFNVFHCVVTVRFLPREHAFTCGLRYVCNLDGKVRKDELRHALYCLFSQVIALVVTLHML